MRKADFGHKDSSFNSKTALKISSQELDNGLNELCQRLGITEQQLLETLKQREKTVQIPTSIFSNTKLSGLELVTKYLVEESHLKIAEISNILQRDYRTIYTTYTEANKKQAGKLSIPKAKHFLPTLILSDRKLSVLEAIVSYLKDELGLKFSQIARELHRDQRNIWTVYNRSKKKSEEHVRTK